MTSIEMSAAHEVTLVTEAGRTPPGEGNFESMLTVALDGIIELSGAERGMILLFGPDAELLVEKARTHERRDNSSPAAYATRHIVPRNERELLRASLAAADYE